ncbi:DsbA family protein [Noviherbaspirillum massiliense]|uniref:DsbA family protein n=1 Tax=Noviherbaspirillum massiliense TaxID=1465823 RepID=UPI000317A174|nr:thioredoxin domain-containing protein [Noviherbaspirillum massiliense]
MPDLNVPVTPDDHAQGNPSARITLVEYGDYQCPYCAKAHVIVRQLQDCFGEDLRFVYRNFPLTELHPEAAAAAETAEFAGSQGPFWDVHDALYENQALLGLPLYAEIFRQLGLSRMDLQQALVGGACDPKIEADIEGGLRSGVEGTPTFFINGHRYQGDSDLASLAAAIETLRRSAGTH